jgi:pilus assembly protein FimV
MPPAKPEAPRDEDLLDLSDIAEEGSASPAESADADDLDASFEQELEDLFADDLGEDPKAAAPAPAAGKAPAKKAAATFDDALLLEDEKDAAPLPDIDLGLPGDTAAGEMDAAGLDELIDGLGPGAAKPAAAPAEEEAILSLAALVAEEAAGEPAAEPLDEALLLDEALEAPAGEAPAAEPEDVLSLDDALLLDEAAAPAEAGEDILSLDDALVLDEAAEPAEPVLTLDDALPEAELLLGDEEPEISLDQALAETPLELEPAAPAPEPAAGMTDAEIAAEDASGQGLDEIDISPDDMPVDVPDLAEIPLEPAEASLDGLHEPGEAVLSEVLLGEEAPPPPGLDDLHAEIAADMPGSADAALLGLDTEDQDSMDVDALLDQMGDAEIHEALAGKDEASETEAGAVPGAEHILALVEERVGALAEDLRAALRAELAAEIKAQVEQAVPREAARIIREEIAALTRELAAEQE